MMKSTIISTATATAALNAVGQLAAGGYLRIYSGRQPSSTAQEPDGELLAELGFGAPAFNAPVGFDMVSKQLKDDDAARASGRASWCRVVARDGLTALWDGTVGTEKSNLIMSTTDIVKGARVSVRGVKLSMQSFED